MPSNNVKKSSLYPYDSKNLAVIFIYGVDFQRRMNISVTPNSTRLLIILIIIFMSSAAIILFFIRRNIENRRNEIIGTFIDILVAFIGGGNLRMQHKFERCFFGILLIAAFFVTLLFAGDILDLIYRNLNQRISTFQQLASINSPVYIIPALRMYSTRIDEMLR